MRTKKNEKGKSIGLAVYFGILVLLIILTSGVFKMFDLIRDSRFDGIHSFSVAVLGSDHVDLLTVSPQDGTIAKVKIEGVRGIGELKRMSLPIDAFVETKNDINGSAKSFFAKTFFQFGNTKTNLTIVDLARLGIFASGVSSEKAREEVVGINDTNKLSKLTSSIFIDPQILDEKVTIQIINSTNIPGLGGKLAKYITSKGGNVVLVNSSQDSKNRSQIFYSEDSYTLKRVSQMLDITSEKRENNGITEIVIVVGKDRGNIFDQ